MDDGTRIEKYNKFYFNASDKWQDATWKNVCFGQKALAPTPHVIFNTKREISVAIAVAKRKDISVMYVFLDLFAAISKLIDSLHFMFFSTLVAIAITAKRPLY